MRTWPLLILVPLVPVFTLLVLGSVWWTFALYHLGACVLLPLGHSLLWRRLGWREHLSRVGLRVAGTTPHSHAAPLPKAAFKAVQAANPEAVGPGIRLGLVLALLLGGGTVAAFVLWHEPFLAGQDIPAILDHWGVSPPRAALMLVFMVVGNGACEELFWRGWLHHRMADWPRRGAALAITAAAYSSYHVVTVVAFTASWAVVALFLATIFGAGLFFGWLRERFGTVWPSLLAHTGATAGYMAVYLIWVAGA